MLRPVGTTRRTTMPLRTVVAVGAVAAVVGGGVAGGVRVVGAEQALDAGTTRSLVDLVVYGRPAGPPAQQVPSVVDPVAVAAAEAAMVRRVARRAVPLVTSPPPMVVAPSPDAVVHTPFRPSGSIPVPGSGGHVTTMDASVVCAPGWIPPRAELSAADKARLLGRYQLTAGQVYRWDVLVPAALGGDPSDPTNVWPMTSAVDAARKDQLTGWLRAAVCTGARIAGGPASLARMQEHAREYWHWWGVGGPDDPAAQAAWAPTALRLGVPGDRRGGVPGGRGIPGRVPGPGRGLCPARGLPGRARRVPEVWCQDPTCGRSAAPCGVVTVVTSNGNGFPAVAARTGLELPDRGAPRLYARTWRPAGVQPDTHSPNCQCRACGSWDLTTPPAAVAVGPVLAATAPTPPVPVRVAVPVAGGARTGRPTGGTRRRSGPARRVLLPCTVCGVGVDPGYAARTGQTRHGSCRRDEPALAGAR